MLLWILIGMGFLFLEGLVLSDAIRHDRREQPKADPSDISQREPDRTAIGSITLETPHSSEPRERYFSKTENWVSLSTLFFVGAYTIVTFWSFFVGYRALVYFDKAVIEISEKPVRPESNGQVVLFNGPWVTHKVVTFNISLANAGSTSTKNMRIEIACVPVSFFELDKVDPFTHFKWNENSARSEIAGPHQTILAGPCEAETTGDTMLNAHVGIVPIVLMGEVRYDDRIIPSFLPWSHHVTQFSQRVIVDAYDLEHGKIVTRTQSIGQHNCADDCQAEP